MIIFHLQHFLLIDDGLPALRSVEERSLSEPLIGLSHQSLTDLEECWSLVWDDVPALRHQLAEDVRAVVRPLHFVALLDVLHNLRTGVRSGKIIVTLNPPDRW